MNADAHLPAARTKAELTMIRRVFLAFLIFGLTACGGDGTGPESVIGMYILQTIDGDPLPWVLFQIGDDKIEVTAGSVTLNEDRTCSDSITLRSTVSEEVTTDTATDVCTYTTNSQAVTLSYPADNTVSSGSIIGSALTITDDGIIFIFRK